MQTQKGLSIEKMVKANGFYRQSKQALRFKLTEHCEIAKSCEAPFAMQDLDYMQPKDHHHLYLPLNKNHSKRK